MTVEITTLTIPRRLQQPLRDDSPWIVAARFERSLYLRRGSLFLCLGDERIGLGPVNVIVTRLPNLEVDELVRVRASGACIWAPPPWPLADNEACTVSKLRAIRACAAALAPALSVMTVLNERPDTTPVRPRLSAGLALLQQALDGDERGAEAAVFALAGLGHGLTPSGDDVLAGCVLALHALRQSEMAVLLADAIRRIAKCRTSPLSFALLEPACDGEAHAAVHRSIAALLSSQPAEDVVRPLASVGSTSGFDMLAGMLVAAGLPA